MQRLKSGGIGDADGLLRAAKCWAPDVPSFVKFRSETPFAPLGRIKSEPDELRKQGVDYDEAKRFAKKYLEALNEQRRLKFEAEKQATLRGRRPIVQCQVCKRTGFGWAPCWVAPRQIGWEDVDVGEFKELE